MKKRLALVLVFAMLAGLLTILPASAEGAAIPTTAGIYNLTIGSDYASTVTVTPKTTSGVATEATVLIDDKEVAGYYGDTVKFDVNLTGATDGKYYMVFLLSGNSGIPTANNIYYINQATAEDGAVSFNVYPKDMAKGDYHLYISSNADTGITSMIEVASFDYYVPYVLGDVDPSGTAGLININDAMAVINHIVGLNVITDNSLLLAANVNGDNVININDAMEIINYIVFGTSEYIGK